MVSFQCDVCIPGYICRVRIVGAERGGMNWRCCGSRMRVLTWSNFTTIKGCGDVLTKKKLDGHRNQCYNARFTCLDCMVTFNGNDYRGHTVCAN